jgi:hypothetical protein
MGAVPSVEATLASKDGSRAFLRAGCAVSPFDFLWRSASRNQVTCSPLSPLPPVTPLLPLSPLLSLSHLSFPSLGYLNPFLTAFSPLIDVSPLHRVCSGPLRLSRLRLSTLPLSPLSLPTLSPVRPCFNSVLSHPPPRPFIGWLSLFGLCMTVGWLYFWDSLGVLVDDVVGVEVVD